MVKRSKKSKSKRGSLKQKYKVIRKVKEHHKKKAKEVKKLGLNRKRKVEKDPGIPNDWPFKEQELKALEVRRARALEELEQKKAALKERAKKRKMGLLEDDEKEQSIGEGKSINDSTGILKARDNSDRVFYKELVKVIEASDVILEVLDARDPLGTRCVDMEKTVMKSGPEKHLMLLLNKIDLVQKEILLVTINKIPGFQSVDEFLQNVASVRGKLKKGGIVDVEAAARIIFRDWNEGKIPYYTMPPVRNQEEPSEARIVTELGKEFNVNEVYNTESSFIGSLKSTDDFHSNEVPSSHPLKFDETMLEGNGQPLPSTEGNEKQEETLDEGGNDEPMASEEDAEKAKSKSATSRQNEKLYAVEVMLNTKM